MKGQLFLRLFVVLNLMVFTSDVSGQKFKQILNSSNADGRLEIFLLNDAGEVFHKYQQSPNSGWNEWSSLGGTKLQQIFVIKNSAGHLELFALGGDRAVWHKSQLSGNNNWSEWESMGGSNLQNIFVEKNSDGRLELFVLGGDRGIWHKWQASANGGWSEWASFGGTNIQSFFVEKNADGRLELLALGGDKGVWHKWQVVPNGGWGGWSSLGGTNLQQVFVVANADGRLELFALGGDNAIWHKWQVAANGGWGEWAYLGGTGLKKLFVVANADGRLELFVRGGDNAVYHKWQLKPNGGWGEWSSLGGTQLQDFVVGKNADGRLEIFALGGNNADWQKWQLSPNGQWGEWSYQGAPPKISIIIPTGIINNNNYNELAFHYAPIHYQDTDNDNFKADYITSVDYDNNWNILDNWDNLNNFSLPAIVYYSIVETCTHWYITYAFYHPRDWDEYATSEHENDFEGLSAMVRKDGSAFGKIEGIVTISHIDLYSFVPDGTPLSNGGEDIDGKLSFSEFEGSLHPLTSQEAKGHGFKAYPYIGDFSGKNDEDGIMYYPSRTIAEVPTSGNDRHVLYKLVDIFSTGGLWEHQLSDMDLLRSNASVFASFGNLKGDGSGGCGDGGGGAAWCDDDGANAPWNWDGQFNDAHRGDIALDPAHLFQKFYSGLGQFDTKYISNKYISDLLKKGYSSARRPRGWNAAIDINEIFGKLIDKCQ